MNFRLVSSFALLALSSTTLVACDSYSKGGGGGSDTGFGDTGGGGGGSVRLVQHQQYCDPNYSTIDDYFTGWIGLSGTVRAVTAKIDSPAGSFTAEADYDTSMQAFVLNFWADDVDSDCDEARSTTWTWTAVDGSGSEYSFGPFASEVLW